MREQHQTKPGRHTVAAGCGCGVADRGAAPVADDPAGRWPVWKLAVMLYVFAAGAVAINLFMLGLLGQSFGLTALSPHRVVVLAIPLGVPAAWAAGRWARHLLDEGTQ